MRASTHRRPSAQGTPRAARPSHPDSKETLRRVFAGSFGAFLTVATVKHFAACVVFFYLGLFSLNTKHFGTFFAGLFCGFVLVLAVGIDQRFGGLEEYRRTFLERLSLYPQSYPPEFLKKI